MDVRNHLIACMSLRRDIVEALQQADALGLLDVAISLDRAYLAIEDVVAAAGGDRTGALPVPAQP